MNTERRQTWLGISLLLYICIAVPIAAIAALMVHHFVGGYWIPMVAGTALAFAWIVGFHYIIEWLKKHG